MLDPDLLDHAQKGAPRAIAAGDEVFVVGLGRAIVEVVAHDLDLVRVRTPDGAEFLVFTDHIRLERRDS